MATAAAQLSQLSNLGNQFQQPYPYNSATYNDYTNAIYNDQLASASLPRGQIENFLQSPPSAPGGRPANQPAFGTRLGGVTAARSGGATAARSGGRRRKQQPRGPIVAKAPGSGGPIVPIYSYTTLKNGTVVQFPVSGSYR